MNYFLIQATHVTGFEWWSQCGHLVQNTTERPYVAFEVIWTVLPHLRACIVRCSRLRVEEALLVAHDFGDIEVGKLALASVTDQNIGTLDVSMHHIEVVQGLQAAETLYEGRPELVFGETGSPLKVTFNLLKNIAFLRILHDEAECLAVDIQEAFFVLDHIHVPAAGR